MKIDISFTLCTISIILSLINIFRPKVNPWLLWSSNACLAASFYLGWNVIWRYLQSDWPYLVISLVMVPVVVGCVKFLICMLKTGGLWFHDPVMERKEKEREGLERIQKINHERESQTKAAAAMDQIYTQCCTTIEIIDQRIRERKNVIKLQKRVKAVRPAKSTLYSSRYWA